jgi:hypothetical protein
VNGERRMVFRTAGDCTTEVLAKIPLNPNELKHSTLLKGTPTQSKAVALVTLSSEESRVTSTLTLSAHVAGA